MCKYFKNMKQNLETKQCTGRIGKEKSNVRITEQVLTKEIKVDM